MKWINIKDRCPDEHIYVLTYTPDISHPIQIKWVFTNLVKDMMSSKSRFYEVTHWMPLPDAPNINTEE